MEDFMQIISYREVSLKGSLLSHFRGYLSDSSHQNDGIEVANSGLPDAFEIVSVI